MNFPQYSINIAIAFDDAIFISGSISCALNLGKISLYKLIMKFLFISSSIDNILNKSPEALIASVLTL